MTTRRNVLKAAGVAAAVITASSESAQAATNPADLSVLEALAAMHAKQLSAVELLDACIKRADALDPQLMAFLLRTDDVALKAAKASDSRYRSGTPRLLDGIPYGAKDIFYTKGIHTTAASKAYYDFVPDEDATLITRLTAAGAGLVGKVNTHEFAFGASTPPTRNPWNTELHPGGSSGGSGSLVGAHVLPMATGSDTIGSLRIPASVNGIVGVRPTFGLTSRHNVVPLSYSFDTTGLLARTVADAAFLFGFAVAADPKDPTTAGVVSGTYPTKAPESLKGFRLGIADRYFDHGIEASIAASVKSAINHAERLGAEIVNVTLPAVFDDVQTPSPSADWLKDADLLSEALGTVLDLPTVVAFTEASGFHYRLRRERGLKYSQDIDLVLQLCEGISAASYLRAQQLRSVFISEMHTMFTANKIDALVNPTCVAAPKKQQPHGGTNQSGLLNGSANAQNNTPWSFAGFPSMSMPVGLDSGGIPVGLMLSGPPHGESRMFSIALAIEKVVDFKRHTPTVLR